MDANPPMTAQHPNDSESQIPTAEALDVLTAFFTYHAPTAGEVALYEAINAAALNLARTIDRCCPPCSDRTAAVRLVREARMTANAAIACRGANYR